MKISADHRKLTDAHATLAGLLIVLTLGACSVQVRPANVVDKGGAQVNKNQEGPVALNAPFALYGVDFSGQIEKAGRNTKLWVAAWDPDRREIELIWGGARPGFSRAGLAAKIIESPGFWVIDFPFGLERQVASALSLADWQSYLNWTIQSAVSAETLWATANRPLK